jgi:hypothetical protein
LKLLRLLLFNGESYCLDGDDPEVQVRIDRIALHEIAHGTGKALLNPPVEFVHRCP